MMSVGYLAALAIALLGMVLLDRRFRLFFWRDARAAIIVLLVGLAFFVGWDLAGIGLGVFFRGATVFMTGIRLAPEFPIEELFFLLLLCYLTMNLYTASRVVLGRDAANDRGGVSAGTGESEQGGAQL